MNANQHPFLRMGALCISVLMLSAVLASCNKQDPASSPADSQGTPVPVNSQIPKSPAAIVVSADNPMSDAKIELGRRLFFDVNMSVDHSTSCGSCYQVGYGFSDIFPTSMVSNCQHGN